ncbi:hypothetical protein J6590_048442 [Homalodisca vitripennis]|nr:hypothetical protein J6590_048442 [Homalodisca vitripennis]
MALGLYDVIHLKSPSCSSGGFWLDKGLNQVVFHNARGTLGYIADQTELTVGGQELPDTMLRHIVE